MAKNKPLLAALKRAGMQIDGQDVEMETDDTPSLSEQASTKLAALQAAYDSLLAIDPDGPSLVGIKKEIETVKRQTGHTAQSRTVKDLTALDYQLNLHHDMVVREQQKTLEAHETTLQSLKKAVSDQEATMAKQLALNQEVLDHIKTLKEQTAAQLKQVADTSGPEPAPPATLPAQAPGIQVAPTLPPELAQMADTLKTLLAQVTATQLPDSADEQTTAAVTQLKTQMTTALQPLLGNAQGVAIPSYGPAAVATRGVRKEVAPYTSATEPAATAAAAEL